MSELGVRVAETAAADACRYIPLRAVTSRYIPFRFVTYRYVPLHTVR